MAITLRPINRQDIDEISSGEVRKVAPYSFKTATKETVVDMSLFGKTEYHRRSKMKEYEDEYMRTASRHLTIPILNPFLAGREAKVWLLVFPKYKAMIPKIIKGEVAFCPETEEA